ncbi:MAG: M14 family metallopeptidase [Elusimicrobiales bacterium]|jgi:carboxypeptidase T
MRKLALSLVLTGFCCLPPAFAAGSAEKARAAADLSFDRLLNRLTADYAKGLAMPAPIDASTAEDIVPDGRYWVTVYAADSAARTRLLEAGLDIIEIRKDRVSGIISKRSLDLLAKKGFVVAESKPLGEYLRAHFRDFPAADAAYHNYQETTDLLKALASKNSDIASLSSIGKTVQGREIWCLRVNSTAKDAEASPKPGAVYIGNHHAREHLSNEVPLLFAVWLMDNRATPEVSKYLKTLDIYIIPMLNPDGVEYDISTGHYKWQRKNMRVNSDNSIGVDLNRNYDSWFGGEGTSHYPSDDTYCGPSAFSEPESAAIKTFVEARKNLKTLMSYHSYAGTVMYPYGGSNADVADAGDKHVFIKMAQEMAAFTGYQPEKSSDMYVATGDTCDWAYDSGRIFAFTTELEGNGFYPPASIITKTVTNNIKAAAYMLSLTDDPYRTISETEGNGITNRGK